MAHPRVKECEVCGVPITRMSEGRCVQCVAASKRGGPQGSRLLEALKHGPKSKRALMNELGFSEAFTGTLLHRLLSYGMVQRVSFGVYRKAGALEMAFKEHHG